MNIQALPMKRFIDHDGNLVSQLPNWADLSTLTGFYQDMVLTRTYDNKAVALQRTGKLALTLLTLAQKRLELLLGER